MESPLLRFERVSKAYAGDKDAPAALHGLDLDVRRGELLTLLGPSGSGKTTTLMLVAGFEQPSAGRILLEGRDIAGLPAHKRNIGVVFQSYALFPHMTVAENVGFPLEARGVPKPARAAQVAAALDMVRLTGLAERRPAQLSGGQQQRVALARALVFQPPVVLMDEPLGALDKSLREEMQFEIRALHRRLGVTMLYVTHDQAEALTLSDRIAVFRAGRLCQLAPPRDIYDRPADAFVSRFVGENNALPGVVVDSADGECRVKLDCGLTVEATVGDAGGAGSRCVVMVRPERLAVAPVAAMDLGAEDALPAKLLEAIFQGDHIRLRLSLGDGTELVAKRPIGGGQLPSPGDEAAIAWPSGAAFAFREDSLAR